jgi:hypothetical protein
MAPPRMGDWIKKILAASLYSREPPHELKLLFEPHTPGLVRRARSAHPLLTRICLMKARQNPNLRHLQIHLRFVAAPAPRQFDRQTGRIFSLAILVGCL